MPTPPNLSNDSAGFNSRMFRSDRAIRRGFRVLGYGINPKDHKVPSGTIKQFQRDYNHCAEKFGRWGRVDIHGKIDKPTLNALEIAIRWAKKKENTQFIPSARVWQSLCSFRKSACNDHDDCSDNSQRSYSSTDIEKSETNFVEILSNGFGRLRNIHTDDSLRCNIECFDKHGDVVFATVTVPPQGGLPKGRDKSITCPCVFRK